MPAEENDQPSEISPQGSHVGGDVKIEGPGQFAGRDHNQGMLPADTIKLVEVLLKFVSQGYLVPSRLEEALTQFGAYNRQLHEWKELHNYLNSILVVFDQFAVQIERPNAKSRPLDPLAYTSTWRPVNLQVDILVNWAGTINYIGQRYQKLTNGTQTGEEWSIELRSASDAVTSHLRVGLPQPSIVSKPRNGLLNSLAMLRKPSYETKVWLIDLYELTQQFRNYTSKHLFIIDKRLRETAGELYQLAEAAFRQQP